MFTQVSIDSSKSVDHSASTFVDKGTPQVVRDALDFMVATDAHANSQALRGSGLRLLSSFAPYISDPQSDVVKLFMNETIAARYRALGDFASSKPEDKVPPLLVSPEMFARFYKISDEIRYNPTVASLTSRITPLEAFQVDLQRNLTRFLHEIEASDGLSALQQRATLEVAQHLLRYFEQVVHASKKTERHDADTLASEIRTVEKDRVEIFKVIASGFSSSAGKPLGVATHALLNRVQRPTAFFTGEEVKDLELWAKKGELLDVWGLPHEAKQSLYSHWLRSAEQFVSSDVAQHLEQHWMASLFNSSRGMQFIVPPDASPEMKNLAAATRMLAGETAELFNASATLQNYGLHQCSLVTDYSLLRWPRIAEMVLLTRASELRLHFPFDPVQSGAMHREVEIPKYFYQRQNFPLPVSLFGPSPINVVGQEVALVRPGKYEVLNAGSAIHSSELGDLTVELTDAYSVQSRVAKMLQIQKLEQPAFLIERTGSSRPLAIGVFFEEYFRNVPGYKCVNFGKSLTLFLAEESRVVESAPTPILEGLIEPEAAVKIAPNEPDNVGTPLPVEHSPSASVVSNAPSVSQSTAQKPERPTISPELQAQFAAIVREIPKLQSVAKESGPIKPCIPFSEAEIISTLNILKNGEKPGNKALKRLMNYCNEDQNFSDCRYHSLDLLKALKQALEQLHQ